ncbi:hypothetical protein PSPO01_05947 [Paraphaeosphaeria sporulosa]
MGTSRAARISAPSSTAAAIPSKSTSSIPSVGMMTVSATRRSVACSSARVPSDYAGVVSAAVVGVSRGWLAVETTHSSRGEVCWARESLLL